MSGFYSNNCRSHRPRSAQAYYERRRARRAAVASAAITTPPTLDAVAHPENLIAAYYDLKARGGHAPGPDGVTFDHLGPREVAQMMRWVAYLLDTGVYTPGPSRAVAIPKTNGSTRTLHLRNVVDRVISAAILRALGPIWDRMFLPCSYAFRPGLGTWHLIADLLPKMVAERRPVIASDDVYHAFDNVPIDRVLRLHRKVIEDKKLLTLVERVLRGGDDPGRTVGIDQGDPLSPLALTVLLHHAHDVPLTGLRRHPPLFRFADNIVVLCKGVPEGHQALDRSRRHLARAGLTLKGEDGPPADLDRGGEAHVLGFTLTGQDGTPRLGLGRGAWEGLEEALNRARVGPNPPEAARLVVRGWVTSHGPAFEERLVARVVDRLTHATVRKGYGEILSRGVPKWWLLESYARWTRFLTGRGGQSGGGKGRGGVHPGGSAAQRRTGAVS